MKIRTALLCAVLSAACSADESVRQPAAETSAGSAAAAASGTAARAAPYLRDHFVLHALQPIGWSRADFLRTLGAPDSITAETVFNRHDDTRTDTTFVLYHAGLRASIYAVTGGNEMLSELVVSDNRYLRDTGVRIGQSWDEVQAWIGPPQATTELGHQYDCRTCEGAENPVFIVVDNGVVAAIRFTYYVD